MAEEEARIKAEEEAKAKALADANKEEDILEKFTEKDFIVPVKELSEAKRR